MDWTNAFDCYLSWEAQVANAAANIAIKYGEEDQILCDYIKDLNCHAIYTLWL